MSVNRNRNNMSATMNFWRDLRQFDYSPKQRTSPKYNDRNRNKNRK